MLVASNQLADRQATLALSDDNERIGRELSTLIRGAKELHSLLGDKTQPVLDPPAYVLLSRIGEHGPMRLSALAGHVFLDVSTISRQVAELEQAGWVARDRDPEDGRASLVRLSSAGEAALAAGHDQRRRALREVLADWTDDQRQALADQLSRFNEAIAAFRTSAHLSHDLRQENAS